MNSSHKICISCVVLLQESIEKEQAVFYICMTYSNDVKSNVKLHFEEAQHVFPGKVYAHVAGLAPKRETVCYRHHREEKFIFYSYKTHMKNDTTHIDTTHRFYTQTRAHTTLNRNEKVFPIALSIYMLTSLHAFSLDSGEFVEFLYKQNKCIYIIMK